MNRQNADNPLYRISGPADNNDYYRQWLRTDPLFDVLFLSSINLPPFIAPMTHERIPTMTYLAWYGRAVVLSPGRPVNRSNALVAGWADLMGPCLRLDLIVPEQRARVVFVEAVKALLQDGALQQVSTATAATFAARDGAGQHDADNWETIRTGDPTAANGEHAMKILMHLAQNAGPAFSIGGISMIVHVYLAILKRGTMSEAFIDKIVQGMVTDLQIPGIRIDINACRVFFSIFGTYVDENTISGITERWSTMLPMPALRLRLTVEQASGSGLTALSVTGRAIKTYTDFNWVRIVQLYPDEWANLITAVDTVGNNVWYGFKKQLGIVSSTKYKNIAYVAKELLIRINGESSLRTYAGWVRRAKYQAVVDALIADYEAAKTDSIQNAVAMPEVPVTAEVNNLRAQIVAGGDVYA